MDQKEHKVIEGWNENAQNEFWKELKKKRNKLDFVWTAANQFLIGDEQDQATGIRILSFFIEDYIQNKKDILARNKFPRLYKNDILKFCLRVSSIFDSQGQLIQAEDFFRKGEELYFENETDENLKPKSAWEGFLRWTEFNLKHGKIVEAAESLKKFEKSHENQNSFGVFLDLHLQLAYITGDYKESDRIHIERREWNGEISYEQLEELDYTDIKNNPSVDIETASEAIAIYHHIVCPEIYNKDKNALRKLERLFRKSEDFQIGDYEEDFKNFRLIPELGAYLGDVLVNEFDGEWIMAEKLMKFRVKVSNRIINPFKYSFEVVHLGHRLVEDFYEVEFNAINNV